jgi:hypothetical protein
VEYQGKSYSISTLAKQLVGSPVSGYLYFKYDGRIIKSISASKAKAADSSPPVSSVPSSCEAETAETAEIDETSEIGDEAACGGLDPLAGTDAEENAACADEEE